MESSGNNNDEYVSFVKNTSNLCKCEHAGMIVQYDGICTPIGPEYVYVSKNTFTLEGYLYLQVDIRTLFKKLI